jgi:hypothetical protein
MPGAAAINRTLHVPGLCSANRGIEPLRSANSDGGAFVADGADPLLGFDLDQLLHHHPDRRAAQIYALARRTRTSPRRLGRQGDRSTQPIWRHDASTFQAVGGSTTQLAAEAVVRAARALKRGRRSMSKSKQSVTAVRHSRRVTLAPCSPWVEGAADAVVGLQDRSEQAPLARSRRCLRRASPVDRRISDGDRLRTVGEPDPCTRTSRRTRGTTT